MQMQDGTVLSSSMFDPPPSLAPSSKLHSIGLNSTQASFSQFLQTPASLCPILRQAGFQPLESSLAASVPASTSIKSKNQARRFVNNALSVQQGCKTKFHVGVSHDVLPSLMELNSTETGMTITHDHIQEKERTCIGFLAGAHPDATNPDDMQASHESHPVLVGLKIPCKDRSIDLFSANLKIPHELQTQAIHTLVGANQAVDACDRCNRVFGSGKKGDCPQGMKLRHAPGAADARFPVASGTRMKAVKMMPEQKALIDNTRVTPTSTVAGFHTVLDKVVACTRCRNVCPCTWPIQFFRPG
jgi:hypothetical protein